MNGPGIPASSPEQARRRHVIPPAVQASRMQRYSVYLLLVAFLLVAANYEALTLQSVLWFAAGLCAAFSLLCAVCVVVLHGLAWNFERMREELHGGRQSQAVGTPDPHADPRPAFLALSEDDGALDTGPAHQVK